MTGEGPGRREQPDPSLSEREISYFAAQNRSRMNPFAPQKILVFVFCCCFVEAFAQSEGPLHQYDTQINTTFKSGQRDSFLHFIQLKSALAKQSDSLAVWAWAQYKAQRFFSDQPKTAIEVIEKALAQKWRNPADSLEWEPFLYLQVYRANYFSREGRLLQSTQAYAEAVKIFGQFRYSDFSAVESIYKPLGANYTRLGDNDKAIAVFQKALEIGGDNETLSGLYANIGIACWNKGDYTAAEENYRKGLSLKEISTAKRGLLLGRMAETQLDLGRVAEAYRTAKEVIRLLRPEDARALEYRARARRVAGEASVLLKNFSEAERLLAGALADDMAASDGHSREIGKDHIALAKLHLKQGRPLLALQDADQAMVSVIPNFKPSVDYPNFSISQSLNPRPEDFYEENTIFEALAIKAAAAQTCYENSAELRWLVLALDCHDLAWQAESILRRVYQYSSSKLHLQQDSRAREESAMNVARLLFDNTGQVKWLERAFAIAERSKAALLLEALQDNLVRQKLSGKDLRFDELTALRQNLSYFEKQLILEPSAKDEAQWRLAADGIRSQISSLEQKLRKDYPALAGFEETSANWLPVSSDFSVGEACVAYFMSEEWLDVFVFQEGKAVAWKRIANDRDFQELLRRYLAYFENDFAILNDPQGYFLTAHLLWQKLLPEETAQASTLTILPDGILNFIPFEALIYNAESAATLRSAAYLVRRHEIRYAWSLAVLRQQKKLQSRAPRYLLSVAPGFANAERGLSPLSPADYDWTGIKGWEVQNLLGPRADIAHFQRQASKFRVLHFSTHAFAGANPRIEFFDNALLLPELYALPLQAELVVLSACQTGLGKEAKGEGMMSLARAFAQAGAACIVSSLWSVNDQSTAHLMRCFYDNLGAGKQTGVALREAKLAYLADAGIGATAQSPYFWAGVVAVGDDREIEQPWRWWHWAILLAGLACAIFALRKLLKTSNRI